MPLILSIIAFSVFIANVIWGASNGLAPLNDVSEMLVLLLAVVLFVTGILKKEARQNQNRD